MLVDAAEGALTRPLGCCRASREHFSSGSRVSTTCRRGPDTAAARAAKLACFWPGVHNRI